MASNLQKEKERERSGQQSGNPKSAVKYKRLNTASPINSESA